MPSEEDFLIKLVSDWLEAAISALGNSQDCVERINLIESWAVNEDGSFEKLPFSYTYSSKVDQIVFRQNPHWDQVQDIVLNDPAICQLLLKPRQLAPGFSGRLVIEEWFKRLLPVPVHRSGCLQLAYLSGVKPDIGAFLNHLRTGRRARTTLWPILGLHTDSPIELEDGVEFRALRTDEKMRLLRVGLIRTIYHTRIEKHHTEWFGLIYVNSLNDAVNSAEDVDGAHYQRELDEQQSIVEDYLAASSFVVGKAVHRASGNHHPARVFYDGPVDFGTIRDSIDIAAEFTMSGFEHYVSDEDRHNIVRVWKTLRGQKLSQKRALQTAIGIALRRLYYASTRVRPQDQLLDLMVAAEALYGGDGKSEKTYRLSLGAALLSDEENRLEVFSDFKNAYEERSKIVHGTSVSSAKLRTLITKIERRVKSGAWKLIDDPNAAREWPNWQNLILQATLHFRIEPASGHAEI